MTHVTGTGPTSGDETAVESAAPKLPYWHVWTHDAGATHQIRCELSASQMQSMGGCAAPRWNDYPVTASATVLVASLPVDWIGTAIPSRSESRLYWAAGRASRWEPARSPSAATRTRSPTAPDGGGIVHAPSATHRPFSLSSSSTTRGGSPPGPALLPDPGPPTLPEHF